MLPGDTDDHFPLCLTLDVALHIAFLSSFSIFLLCISLVIPFSLLFLSFLNLAFSLLRRERLTIIVLNIWLTSNTKIYGMFSQWFWPECSLVDVHLWVLSWPFKRGLHNRFHYSLNGLLGVPDKSYLCHAIFCNFWCSGDSSQCLSVLSALLAYLSQLHYHELLTDSILAMVAALFAFQILVLKVAP